MKGPACQAELRAKEQAYAKDGLRTSCRGACTGQAALPGQRAPHRARCSSVRATALQCPANPPCLPPPHPAQTAGSEGAATGTLTAGTTPQRLVQNAALGEKFLGHGKGASSLGKVAFGNHFRLQESQRLSGFLALALSKCFGTKDTASAPEEKRRGCAGKGGRCGGPDPGPDPGPCPSRGRPTARLLQPRRRAPSSHHRPAGGPAISELPD